jgi:hypothetical protein
VTGGESGYDIEQRKWGEEVGTAGSGEVCGGVER